jgi:hypothetical protein
MLYGETVAVCSEIHTKHVNKAEFYYKLSPYRAVNTRRQGFRNESLNAVWRNNRGLFRDPYKHIKIKLTSITASVRTAQ